MRGRAPRIRRAGRALALLLALCVGPALAHSELRRSFPANGDRLEVSPQAIELSFNEKVQVTAIRLHVESGREIPLERAAIAERSTERRSLPPLEAGAYRIEWRAISADGHPVGGAIRFTVGAR